MQSRRTSATCINRFCMCDDVTQTPKGNSNQALQEVNKLQNNCGIVKRTTSAPECSLLSIEQKYEQFADAYEDTNFKQNCDINQGSSKNLRKSSCLCDCSRQTTEATSPHQPIKNCLNSFPKNEENDDMEENLENNRQQEHDEEDLGNYITQVVTDIGHKINTDLIHRFAQVPLKSKFELADKKQRCKMASVANPYGVAPDEYSKFAIHVYQYLSYIKTLDIPTIEELEERDKLVTLEKRKDNKKLLVFDLDETLVHCIFNDKDIHDADVFLDILMPNKSKANTGFNIRPYWKELMDAIYDDWEIVVFTASCKNYADTILDYLDPDNKYFHHRYYRETCWKTPEGVYVKDMRVFHQWKLEDIILVDNAVYSFGFQLDNGIPIFPYIQGKDDEQLLYLKEYLELITDKEIIKDLKKTFKMRELHDIDIDSFLEHYENNDDSEDNADDILDQMVKNNIFREKGQSFTHGLFHSKPRHSTEGLKRSSGSNHELDKQNYLAVADQEELFRNHSNNVQSPAAKRLIDDSEVDNLFASAIEQRSSDVKPKTKKKRSKLSNLKKFQSVCTIAETRLDVCTTASPFVQDSSSQEEESKDLKTPKVLKHKKKLKKRCKVMKQLRLVVNIVNDVPPLEEYAPAQQISLFRSCSNNNKNSESHSNESDDSPSRPNLKLSSLGSRTDNFKFQRQNTFCNSALIASKRNSSPLGRTYDGILNTSDKDKVKRKVSTSSSSDGDFERGEDCVESTECSIKHPYSRISSSDNTDNVHDKSINGYTITPFEEVIEAKEGEEYSPVLKSRMRRDSMAEALDSLSLFFDPKNIVGRRISNVANLPNASCSQGSKCFGCLSCRDQVIHDKKRSVKVSQSKLLLKQCEIFEASHEHEHAD